MSTGPKFVCHFFNDWWLTTDMTLRSYLVAVIDWSDVTIHFSTNTEVLKTFTNSLEKSPVGDIEQQRHDLDIYKNWMKKDSYVRFTMLNIMWNDLIAQFDVHTTAKERWDALQATFIGTSTTRLCQMQMYFDSYKMNLKQSMVEYLAKYWRWSVI